MNSSIKKGYSLDSPSQFDINGSIVVQQDDLLHLLFPEQGNQPVWLPTTVPGQIYRAQWIGVGLCSVVHQIHHSASASRPPSDRPLLQVSLIQVTGSAPHVQASVIRTLSHFSTPPSHVCVNASGSVVAVSVKSRIYLYHVGDNNEEKSFTDQIELGEPHKHVDSLSFIENTLVVSWEFQLSLYTIDDKTGSAQSKTKVLHGAGQVDTIAPCRSYFTYESSPKPNIAVCVGHPPLSFSSPEPPSPTDLLAGNTPSINQPAWNAFLLDTHTGCTGPCIQVMPGTCLVSAFFSHRSETLSIVLGTAFMPGLIQAKGELESLQIQVDQPILKLDLDEQNGERIVAIGKSKTNSDILYSLTAKCCSRPPVVGPLSKPRNHSFRWHRNNLITESSKLKQQELTDKTNESQENYNIKGELSKPQKSYHEKLSDSRDSGTSESKYIIQKMEELFDQQKQWIQEQFDRIELQINQQRERIDRIENQYK